MHFIYSLGIGGAEKLAYDMIAGLPPDRYRPIVVCVGENGPLGDMFRERGCPVYFHPNSPGQTFRIVSWVKEIIEREQVSVIHAHQYNPLHYSVLSIAGNSRVNLVYTEHGRMYPERFNWKRYLTNPFFALRVNHLVSISHSTKDAMIRYDNFPARRIKVIHNGIHFDVLNPDIDLREKRRSLGIGENSRIIGTASRLEEIKNIPMMLRGMKKVLERCPDTVLVIAGHGSQAGQLKELAQELGIADQVRFLGLRLDLPELFRLMEVFLLVSFTEGISITLLEALGSGVPVVVTRTGGNPEVVVDGGCGYLIEVGDEVAMGERVMGLLEHPEQGQQMGKRGRELVRNYFSFGAMLDGYMSLYDNPCSERRKGGKG